MPSVAIIGGGISGLSAAYYLSKAGIPTTLIEARPRLGGVVQTENIRNCVIEGGPDSFLSAKPWAMDLIRELGLESEVIGSNDHQRKTYIWKRGRLMELPDGLQFLVPTRIWPMALSPLVSLPTKLRMALEYFRRPPAAAVRDRSVTDFVEEHYGREAVEYLAEPLLSGIYGGDPGELSVSSVLPRFVELETKYGSLTRGVLVERRTAATNGVRGLPLFRTLRGGLGRLIQAMTDAAGPGTTVVHKPVESIERTETGFRLRAGDDWLIATHIVLACEAHQAARITTQLDSRISSLLASVPYSSSMTVALGFDRGAVKNQMRGFGFLVPKRERRRLLAATWVGNKFPDRVPDSLAVLRCFLGGSSAGAVLQENDRSILSSVRDELSVILGLTAEPLFWKVFRWPLSMAQYTVGHRERIAELEARFEAIPGLYAAGNAYHGIGIPDCIRMGKLAAESITRKAGPC